MIRTAFESSTIADAAYDVRRCQLDLRFVNGRVYRYLAVPAAVFRQLVRARSQGQYFNRCIRDAGYACIRLA